MKDTVPGTGKSGVVKTLLDTIPMNVDPNGKRLEKIPEISSQAVRYFKWPTIEDTHRR